MRHNYYGRKLNRNKNERAALFKNLVRSLILSGKIETTHAKAKAISPTVDRLINQAKSPATRRLVSQFVVDKSVFEKLVNELTPKMKSRNSGYTSIVRISRRLGDDAKLVSMTLLLDGEKAFAKTATPAKETQKAEETKVADQSESESQTATAKPAKKTTKKEAAK